MMMVLILPRPQVVKFRLPEPMALQKCADPIGEGRSVTCCSGGMYYDRMTISARD